MAREKEKLLSFHPYPTINPKKARELRDQAKGQVLNDADRSLIKQKPALSDRLSAAKGFTAIAEEYLNKLRNEGKAKRNTKLPSGNALRSAECLAIQWQSPVLAMKLHLPFRARWWSMLPIIEKQSLGELMARIEDYDGYPVISSNYSSLLNDRGH